MQIRTLIIFAYILAFSSNVSASYEQMHKRKEKYSFSLGALGLIVPKYYGADKYRFLVVPNLNFTYGKCLTISPYRGISFNFNELKPFKFNAGIRYKFWFSSDRSSRFPGISDPKPYLEGYLTSKYMLKPVSFSLGAYHSLSKLEIGGFLRAGVSYFIRLSNQSNVFLGTSTKISNKKHMQTLYKVLKSEALSANISEYDLSSGIENIKFNTGVTYQFNERWNTHVMFSAKRILFDAAKSPLIENKTQFSANISLNYKF